MEINDTLEPESEGVSELEELLLDVEWTADPPRHSKGGAEEDDPVPMVRRLLEERLAK
jgi:hypothetical protein